MLSEAKKSDWSDVINDLTLLRDTIRAGTPIADVFKVRTVIIYPLAPSEVTFALWAIRVVVPVSIVVIVGLILLSIGA